MHGFVVGACIVVSALDPYLILPSRPVFMTVAFDEVPTTPPDDLAAFVSPVDDPTSSRGWQLTEDAVAFGDYDIVRRMNEWHNTWLRAWSLGQRSMLRVLRQLVIDEVPDLSKRSRALFDAVCGDWTEPVDADVGASDLDHLDAVMQRARTMIHRAGRSGFGVVDTTPGSTRVGLLRAWSTALGDLVLAADESSVVKLTPDGLELGVRSTRSKVSQIQEVSFQANEVALVTPNEIVDLPSTIGRPLSWLVAEATAWRIRPVPETLVWAETFANVADALDFANEHRAVVTLRHDWSSSSLDFVAQGRPPESTSNT